MTVDGLTRRVTVDDSFMVSCFRPKSTRSVAWYKTDKLLQQFQGNETCYFFQSPGSNHTVFVTFRSAIFTRQEPGSRDKRALREPFDQRVTTHFIRDVKIVGIVEMQISAAQTAFDLTTAVMLQ